MWINKNIEVEKSCIKIIIHSFFFLFYPTSYTEIRDNITNYKRRKLILADLLNKTFFFFFSSQLKVFQMKNSLYLNSLDFLLNKRSFKNIIRKKSIRRKISIKIRFNNLEI